MTYQVEAGDVLEYLGDGKLESAFRFKEGRAYKVEDNGSYLFIRSEDGGEAYSLLNNFLDFGFHLVTAPPATIQHEGYNYTRGEPVVPEWVKDGAWVVSKDDNAVVKINVDERSIGVHNANGTYHSTIEVSKADTYLRPFTNEDWKWGMWAEYKGEKVFVSERGATGIYASKPSSGYFYAPFSLITPTTAP